MKNLTKKILVILTIIGAISMSFASILPSQTFADDTRLNGEPCTSLLGLTPWDCGVQDIDSEESLKAGIWTIVANIATDIAVIATYLILGYVIYGGYLYTFSGGDPNKVAVGRKTLTQAFIGLAIVMSATLIMGTIRFILAGSADGNISNCTTTNCVEPEALVEGLISWFIGIAGIVSAIFLVYGGITYITSSGDASKLQKAKNMILYSLIGLAIVILATIITAFVSNAIRNANETSLIKKTNISKEVHEIKIN